MTQDRPRASSGILSRLALDFLAASLLMFGLSYWWLGNAVHEVAGTGMFLLVIVHNGFNRRWYGRIPGARRQARGLLDTGFTLLLLAAMLVLLVTSVLISNTLSGFMSRYGSFTVRQIHSLAAYWALVLVAVHLGLRWPVIMGVAGRLFGIARPNPVRTFVLRVAAAAIAVHGVWSSCVLGIGAKLSMQVTLDWWNFEDSVAGFFVHCTAVVGLYISVTYYGTRWMQSRKRRNPLGRTVTGSLAIMLMLGISGENRTFAESGKGVAALTQAVDQRRPVHLRTDNTIRDILDHPAFAGFGRLILPWDGRTYDLDMHLDDLGSLLPYHTHVDPGTVVGALNSMIDSAAAGRTVFYDIYTEAEKQKDPAKENTGLFFFRGKSGAPFAIVSPGGGFSYVGSIHEGFPYAVELSRRGYNALVLKYRVGQGGTVATQDLAAAISFIFKNASSLGVGTEDYSLWGSSAGARMAAAIGSYGVADYGGGDLPKPASVVMAYTALADHSAHEPPTFVVVGEQDGIAPPAAMERRVTALRASGTEVEYHRYPGLGHGFGLGTGTVADGWILEAIRFWEKSIRGGSLSPPVAQGVHQE